MIVKEVEVILLKEPMFESIVSDTWAALCVGALFWFNYNYIDGSYLVNTLILVLIALKIGAIYKGNKRYTIEEARAHLDDLEESVNKRPKEKE